MTYNSEVVWGSRADNYARMNGLWKPEELLVKKYFTRRDVTVLDIGCGGGRTLIPLAKMGFKKVIGLDISKEMLDRTKKKLRREKLENVKLVKSDAAELPFKEDSIDYIFNGFNSLDCVYPSKRREKALDEVARVMKPGGIIIHSFHNILTIHGRLRFWYWTPRMILEWLLDLPRDGGYLSDIGGAKMFHTTVGSEIKRFNKRGFHLLEKLQGGMKKTLSKIFVIMAMRYEGPK